MSPAPVPPVRRGRCPGVLAPMPTGDGLLVRLHPPGGALTAQQARAVADAARACGNGFLDVTGRGNLQLRGVREESHAALVERLAAVGLVEPVAQAGAEFGAASRQDHALGPGLGSPRIKPRVHLTGKEAEVLAPGTRLLSRTPGTER